MHYATNLGSCSMFWWDYFCPSSPSQSGRTSTYTVYATCSQVNFHSDEVGCKLTPSHCIVKEIITPHAKYCTLSFNIGPMPAVYTSIPIVCYDVLLVVLAVAILVRHLKERRGIHLRANTSMVMIVRYHIIYFVL
jgi:hypothetical protein